jgi:hypothetical protein
MMRAQYSLVSKAWNGHSEPHPTGDGNKNIDFASKKERFAPDEPAKPAARRPKVTPTASGGTASPGTVKITSTRRRIADGITRRLLHH